MVYTYGSVILWNLNFGSFCEWRHKLARSWSICVILSDHRIIVPHLNDNWFFFHKLYHPKLLWFTRKVQWYCEILILVHFWSDGTCQILKPMCHSEWPPYYNLRSGSILVLLWKLHSGGQGETKRSLIQTFYETSAAHFFDWLTFAESANQNYFRCLFF